MHFCKWFWLSVTFVFVRDGVTRLKEAKVGEQFTFKEIFDGTLQLQQRVMDAPMEETERVAVSEESLTFS